MSEDLTSRVAELAAAIEAQLLADAATATAAVMSRGQWYDYGQEPPSGTWTERKNNAVIDSDAGVIVFDEGCPTTEQAAHIARHDPARVLRRVKATRDLVAEILAERHQYVDGDPWFSCSQATEPGEDDSEPGSACADDERRGKPCDCGRDARVARLLGIIASEWEG